MCTPVNVLAGHTKRLQRRHDSRKTHRSEHDLGLSTRMTAASTTKILRSYWFTIGHVTLDIIGYLTHRGTIVGHNISNVRHIPMSNR